MSSPDSSPAPAPSSEDTKSILPSLAETAQLPHPKQIVQDIVNNLATNPNASVLDNLTQSSLHVVDSFIQTELEKYIGLTPFEAEYITEQLKLVLTPANLKLLFNAICGWMKTYCCCCCRKKQN